MNIFIGVLLWIPAAVARLLLFVFGWIAVALSLVADGKFCTPRMWRLWANVEKLDPKFVGASRWTLYKEMAWRNPTMGLREKWQQPVDELVPNPDELVRTGRFTNGALVKHKRASRFMSHGIFWEYWTLSAITKGFWKGRFWEFRIGWKFVDGDETFYPTFQLGPKK